MGLKKAVPRKELIREGNKTPEPKEGKMKKINY